VLLPAAPATAVVCWHQLQQTQPAGGPAQTCSSDIRQTQKHTCQGPGVDMHAKAKQCKALNRKQQPARLEPQLVLDRTAAAAKRETSCARASPECHGCRCEAVLLRECGICGHRLHHVWTRAVPVQQSTQRRCCQHSMQHLAVMLACSARYCSLQHTLTSCRPAADYASLRHDAVLTCVCWPSPGLCFSVSALVLVEACLRRAAIWRHVLALQHRHTSSSSPELHLNSTSKLQGSALKQAPQDTTGGPVPCRRGVLGLVCMLVGANAILPSP
jgi:hypothetical protein